MLPGIPYVVGKEREEQYKKNAKAKPVQEDGSGILANWKFWVTERQPGVSAERSAEHFADYMQSGTRSWWAYHSVFTYEAETRLPLVKQPVFIPNTHGSLKDQTREAAKLFPDAGIVEVPELHHGIFDVGVDRLAELSRGFLDSE